MADEFTAIDVETANPDMASICQIGMVRFVDGVIAEQWGTFVNPVTWFAETNTSIHGIRESTVARSPTFPGIAEELRARLSRSIVASHTAFDRLSLGQAATQHGIELPDIAWLDTATVTRRAWPELRQRGYGLADVTAKLGIEFEHHSAIEDARAAGEVLLRACRVAQCSVSDWLRRVAVPPVDAERIAREGNPDGALYGHHIVFTGRIVMPRKQAAALAAAAGCKVTETVGKKTTLLVVGDQDLRQTRGEEMSNKHRRAKELIADGQDIRILKESDFLALVDGVSE